MILLTNSLTSRVYCWFVSFEIGFICPLQDPLHHNLDNKMCVGQQLSFCFGNIYNCQQILFGKQKQSFSIYVNINNDSLSGDIVFNLGLQ